MMNNYTFFHEISACYDENICISHTSPGFLIFSPGPDSDWAEAAFAFLTELFARAELDAKGRHVCVLEPLDLTTWATCGPGRPLDLSHRERWAKLLFERFAVATMYMGARQIFALYTAGETTGEYFNTGVFRQRDGQWKAFTWQATRIPSEAGD